MTSDPTPLDVGEDGRLTNLKRAARYPWKDDGRCAVKEAPGSWAALVEKCYDALDQSRIQFVDEKKVCPVAQAGAVTADQAIRLVGICLLAQPEIVVGAVIVIGVVVIATAIATELEAAERAKKPGAMEMAKATPKPRPVALPDDAECELVGTGGQGEICRYKCEGLAEIIEVIMTTRRCEFGERLPWRKLKLFPRYR